jgi:hypothetical protein
LKEENNLMPFCKPIKATPWILLAQELAEKYEAVNSLCVVVEKKYGNKKVQMNPHQEPLINDQPIILSKELLGTWHSRGGVGDAKEQEHEEEIDEESHQAHEEHVDEELPHSIHEYFDENFEDQAPQDFIEEQEHEEEFIVFETDIHVY